MAGSRVVAKVVQKAVQRAGSTVACVSKNKQIPEIKQSIIKEAGLNSFILISSIKEVKYF